MWTGWNTSKDTEISPRKSVYYMKHIHLPPSKTGVVKEIFKCSQVVAEECGQKYTLVTRMCFG